MTLGRIGMRFISGLIGVVILFGIFLVVNPDVRDHLPIIGKDTCGEVSDWDEESREYRPDYVIEMGKLGPWEEWTADDYQTFIDTTDTNLAWFEDNAGPEDAQRARDNYVSNLTSIREILVAAQNGEYESEATFTNELNAYNLLLNDPATDFVAMCL